MQIIVGLDFGKYIGVAKADSELKMPFVYGTFFFKELVVEIKKIKPDIIVAGLPLLLNGEEGKQCAITKSQIQTLLSFLNYKPFVYFQDERFSSKFTNNHEQSAKWILEIFLKKHFQKNNSHENDLQENDEQDENL